MTTENEVKLFFTVLLTCIADMTNLGVFRYVRIIAVIFHFLTISAICHAECRFARAGS
jgi:hypothetical protein